MGRVHPAGLLKVAVVPLFATIVVAAFLGALWVTLGAFVVLLLTIRLQRSQEAKRLHGYHRKRPHSKPRNR